MKKQLHMPSDETLATVNRLLPIATPEGAYCMGIVCSIAWREGKEPSQTLLENVAIEGTVAGTLAIFAVYNRSVQ